MKKVLLDNNVAVPLGFVVAGFGTFIGFVAWLTTLANNTTAHAKALDAQAIELHEMKQSSNDILREIHGELEAIKARLDYLSQKKEK